jgi:hypothetical protein
MEGKEIGFVNHDISRPDRMPLSAIDLAGLSPAEGVIRMPL